MNIDFQKYPDGLVPVIVQDGITSKVLMLGYMNDAAVQRSLDSGKVTFFSRKKKALWTKGETSGNYLNLLHLSVDCDNDALLAKVRPEGPTCHKGYDTCWGEINLSNFGFLTELEGVINDRKNNPNLKDSYVSALINSGINKVAQKVGEEAVELVIEAKDSDDKAFLNEAADLLFHLLILLQTRGFNLSDVEKVLSSRHN